MDAAIECFGKSLATLESSQTILNEVRVYPAECLKTLLVHITNALTIFLTSYTFCRLSRTYSALYIVNCFLMCREWVPLILQNQFLHGISVNLNDDNIEWYT